MCMICVEFQKDRMTTGEARRALGEMIDDLDPDHVDEIEELLTGAQNTDSKTDDDKSDDD